MALDLKFLSEGAAKNGRNFKSATQPLALILLRRDPGPVDLILVAAYPRVATAGGGSSSLNFTPIEMMLTLAREVPT